MELKIWAVSVKNRSVKTSDNKWFQLAKDLDINSVKKGQTIEADVNGVFINKINSTAQAVENNSKSTSSEGKTSNSDYTPDIVRKSGDEIGLRGTVQAVAGSSWLGTLCVSSTEDEYVEIAYRIGKKLDDKIKSAFGR